MVWCGGERERERERGEEMLRRVGEYSVNLKSGFVPNASPSQNRRGKYPKKPDKNGIYPRLLLLYNLY